ncbi:unnamed protein product [Brassica rapa subsp. trilocularis]
MQVLFRIGDSRVLMEDKDFHKTILYWFHRSRMFL